MHQPTIQGPDYGPEIRSDRVVITEWRDPDSPVNSAARKPRMVKGASANPVHLISARIKGITRTHQQAAERLMDDFELGVCGAKPGRARLVAVKTPFGPGMYINDVRLDRVRRCEMAMDALGHNGRVAINYFVFNIPQRDKNTLQDFAALHGLGRMEAKALLLQTLDKLVEFYDPEFDPEDPFGAIAAVEVAAAA
jgi:hypothetical protein